MDSSERISAYDVLGIDSDPFKNGTDSCCTIHTNANRYKKALNELRNPKEDTDIAGQLQILFDSNKLILASAYRMAEVWAKIYVLEMSE